MPPPPVFYTWVARSRSGSSSFTALAPEYTFLLLLLLLLLNKLSSSFSSSSSGRVGVLTIRGMGAALHPHALTQHKTSNSRKDNSCWPPPTCHRRTKFARVAPLFPPFAIWFFGGGASKKTSLGHELRGARLRARCSAAEQLPAALCSSWGSCGHGKGREVAAARAWGRRGREARESSGGNITIQPIARQFPSSAAHSERHWAGPACARSGPGSGSGTRA